MGAMGLMMGCFLVPFKNPRRLLAEAASTEKEKEQEDKKKKTEGFGEFVQALRKVC